MSFNDWPEQNLECLKVPPKCQSSATTTEDPTHASEMQAGSASASPAAVGQPVPPIVQSFIAASDRQHSNCAHVPGPAAASLRSAPKPSAAPTFNIGSSEDLIQLGEDIQSVDELSDEVFPGSDRDDDVDILRAVQEIEKVYSSSCEQFVPPPGSVQEGGQLAVPALYGTEGPLSMDRSAAHASGAPVAVCALQLKPLAL